MDHWRRRCRLRRENIKKLFFQRKKPVKIPVVQDPWERVPKTFDCARGFSLALRKRGFSTVGRGYYSTVYAKGKNKRVIKVSRYDGGWMEYIRWASKEGYAGTLSPKVYSYKWIKGREEGFGVSVMERMKSTLSQLEEDNDNKVIPYLFQYSATYKNTMAGKILNTVCPGLNDFGMKLREEFKDCSLDLHAGNFMVREDNSIVVTDPISNCSRVAITTRYKTKDLMAA